jgi:hypothetical protein
MTEIRAGDGLKGSHANGSVVDPSHVARSISLTAHRSPKRWFDAPAVEDHR